MRLVYSSSDTGMLWAIKHKNQFDSIVAAGVYLSEAQNPIPPPLTHCIRVYSILIHTGKGGEGGELNQREG
jgi:hypothetical protein